MWDCNLLPEHVFALFKFLTNMSADEINGHCVVRARDDLRDNFNPKPALDNSKPTISAYAAVGRTKLSKDGLTNRMYLGWF